MSFRKYTKETPPGLWSKVKDFFALDKTRSSGISFNESYRNPMPGSRPEIYKEPVTAPANDIAENPYFARDVRRQYPSVSVFTQSRVAGLLTYGNKDAPAIPDGKAGELVLAKIDELQLTSALEQQGVLAVLGKDGMPPLPMGRKGRAFKLDTTAGFAGNTMAHGVDYPVRCFN
ncbi:hypothetical protein BCR37DRAFT_388685 [Protomyces lactucae-debilis]|uniref:NADH-ubiquinone oxidoreductase 21.3 kDa subunit n=1 Tax=Protomyces lactucae-debilis TaxID=2754530 RepID=A0A1Y2F5A7_PROLT|nr:uncharacterized protein BCR37DRAFT_388685 [Protomyces lactucae-debilis]ORY79090.1 hypothetical protein BCR37DRAFT_388685 [Protomyces lactucae-debilis]